MTKAGEQGAICPTCSSDRKSIRRKIFTPTEEAWCFDEWHREASTAEQSPEPRREHDWDCTAIGESGRLFWRCKGCFITVPYPSPVSRFPTGCCESRSVGESPAPADDPKFTGREDAAEWEQIRQQTSQGMAPSEVNVSESLLRNERPVIDPKMCNCAATLGGYLFCHGNDCAYRKAVTAALVAAERGESPAPATEACPECGGTMRGRAWVPDDHECWNKWHAERVAAPPEPRNVVKHSDWLHDQLLKKSQRVSTLEQALRTALIPLAALVLSGECTTAESALCEDLKADIIKGHDAILAALSGESRQ